MLYLLAFFVKALMSTTFVIAQQALAIVGPVYLIGLRMTAAGLILLGSLALWQRPQLRIQRSDLSSFLKVILFHIYIAYLAEFWGLQYLSGPKVALLFNFGPFITALLSYFILRERLLWSQWLGLLISFTGFLLLLLEQHSAAQLVSELWSVALPDLAILLSSTSSVFAWITIQKLTRQNYSPLLINGVGMLGGGLLALVTVPFFESFTALSWSQAGELTLWIGLLILIANVICYNLYTWLLRRFSATFLSLASLTMPIFAALWEWLWLGKTMSLTFYLAFVIISIGLSLFYLGESRRLARLSAQLNTSAGVN